MYGFESTVLLALLSGNAFSAERPFYPADIAVAVAALPQPRALVTTPIHLRTLLASEVELPPVDLIVSATAPLQQDLALEVEAKYQTVLLEIYGSTETGQIALRRTAESPAWRLWPDVRLSASNQQVYAHGGHVEQLTIMGDVIEITGHDEFLLHGRTADSINVAGKRSSFGYLNAQLNAVPGVIDGVFFLKHAASGPTGVVRLGAAVVAPGLSAGELMEQLRQRVDPAFLPRPLLVVERLPRNAAGKLPQQAMQQLASEHAQGRLAGNMHSTLTIPADHPSFPGHFPNFPVLPGAVLLDAALDVMQRARGIDLVEWQIASAKFLAAVRPGDVLSVQHDAPRDGLIRFTIRTAHHTVANGVLSNAAQDGIACPSKP